MARVLKYTLFSKVLVHCRTEYGSDSVYEWGGELMEHPYKNTHVFVQYLTNPWLHCVKLMKSFAHIHPYVTCECVCSAPISWGNGLNNDVAFFAIWPCGWSLCSVVSKIHKGAQGWSIFECVRVCVFPSCLVSYCSAFLALNSLIWCSIACRINFTDTVDLF